MSVLQSLINDYQNAYNTARAANESRYAELKNLHDQRRNAAMGDVAGISGQAKADAEGRYTDLRGKMEQNLIGRGLGNTTVRVAADRAAMGDLNAEMRRINDDKLMRQLGVRDKFGGEGLAFMERRTDAYPDMSLLAQMAMADSYSSRPAPRFPGMPSAGGGFGGVSGGSSTPSDFLRSSNRYTGSFGAGDARGGLGGGAAYTSGLAGMGGASYTGYAPNLNAGYEIYTPAYAAMEAGTGAAEGGADAMAGPAAMEAAMGAAAGGSNPYADYYNYANIYAGE